MIGYLALSFAVGVLSCCCSCMMGAFQTSDEENQEYSSYQQARVCFNGIVYDSVM